MVTTNGGFASVNNHKAWRSIWLSVHPELGTSSTAPTSLKSNYEKWLLQLEHYFTSGDFEIDLLNGTMPECDPETGDSGAHSSELHGLETGVSGANDKQDDEDHKEQ